MEGQANDIRALRARIDDLICECFEDFSVIQISRALGFQGSEKVYRVLRERGVVGKITTRHRFQLHDVFRQALAAAKLSFPKWCNSQGFSSSIQEAGAALLALPTPEDEFASQVHAAFEADFPNLYREHFFGEVRERRRQRYQASNYDLMIKRDREKNIYVASVPEIPDAKGYGTNWDTALSALKLVLNLHRRIARLEALKGTAEFARESLIEWGDEDDEAEG